jgi:hypothetical protein
MNNVGPLFSPWPGTAGLAQQPKRHNGPSRSAHGTLAQRAVTALRTGATAGIRNGDKVGHNGGGGHQRGKASQPSKVVGGGTHRGHAVAWRQREAVSATEFNSGEALRWGTAVTEGSCGTPMTRGR